MYRGARRLLAVIACVAMSSMIGCKATGPADANRQNHSLLLHAAGTIVSIEERAHDEQSEDLLPGPRVCFSIDSFAEIPSAERAAYESAERTRLAKQGPRCRDTAIDRSAVHFKTGDPVDIYFKLDDQEQISVARISTHGVDL
jgi:hypothetical protein